MTTDLKFTKDRDDFLKIKALKNFALTKKMKEWVALELVVIMFENSFMDDPVRDFLDYLLKKYNIDYSKWAFKTKWVKRKIMETLSNSSQMEFDFAYDITYEEKQRMMEYPSYLVSFPHTQFTIAKKIHHGI